MKKVFKYLTLDYAISICSPPANGAYVLKENTQHDFSDALHKQGNYVNEQKKWKATGLE